MAKLSDEKVCREAMEQWRWNGESFCPHCNGTKPYKLKDGKTCRCRERLAVKILPLLLELFLEILRFNNDKLPI